MPTITIYIVIKYLRKNYDKERAIAEERARAVEAQNRQILIQKELIEKSDTEKNKVIYLCIL